MKKTAIILVILFIAAAAGLSPHKPIDPTALYKSTLHELHGVLATLAGISISAGFIWQGVKLKYPGPKVICFYLAVVCFAFPMMMLALNDYQGIIQRLMYLQVFIWMWVMFPDKIVNEKKVRMRSERKL